MRSLVLLLAAILAALAGAAPVVVGSKAFTESYVLGEIAVRKLRDAGIEAEHKKGVGSTGIAWAALKSGSIQFYPDYTGTVAEELLKIPGADAAKIRARLKPLGIGMTEDLGFNDSYGLVVRRETAERLGLKTISDLARHPELRCGITPELMDRSDGWRPLLAKYGYAPQEVRSIQHSLGYAALAAEQTDVKDCYTTDAEIARFDLVTLRDDRRFFPLYRAVFLYRLDASPKAVETLGTLAGTVTEAEMIAMNAAAGKADDPAAGAALYFAEPPPPPPTLAVTLLRLLGQHLALVGASSMWAVLVGVPLGIRAARPGALSSVILGVTGVLQTVPSLALLAFLVPLLGVGATTAVVALFLYSLLPIVRNTATGLQGIPGSLRESAEALGLSPGDRLRLVYLPMALPTILAGIKTSVVINVGTATLAALIGAGGFGEPIVQGLATNTPAPILRGAIPAALLAVAVQLLFDRLEPRLVSRGLRL